MSKKSINIGFVDTYENAKRFFVHVLSKRYDVVESDMILDVPDYLFFGDINFGNSNVEPQYDACRRIFFTGENQRPRNYRYDYAISFDLVNSPTQYRLPLYALELYAYVFDGQCKTIEDVYRKPNIDFEKEFDSKIGLCSYVQTNPNNPLREATVRALSAFEKVDCGGKHLNNIGYVLPRDDRQHKIDFLRARKFNLAMESSYHHGYTTEKILDAMHSLTIPIYWGNTYVNRDFNPKAFINMHDFKTMQELVDFVKDLSYNKRNYCDMLAQPMFTNNILPSQADIDLFLDWFDLNVYKG